MLCIHFIFDACNNIIWYVFIVKIFLIESRLVLLPAVLRQLKVHIVCMDDQFRLCLEVLLEIISIVHGQNPVSKTATYIKVSGSCSFTNVFEFLLLFNRKMQKRRFKFLLCIYCKLCILFIRL